MQSEQGNRRIQRVRGVRMRCSGLGESRAPKRASAQAGHGPRCGPGGAAAPVPPAPGTGAQRSVLCSSFCSEPEAKVRSDASPARSVERHLLLFSGQCLTCSCDEECLLDSKYLP